MKNKEKYNVQNGVKWILLHTLRYPINAVIFLGVLFLSIYYQNKSSIYLGRIFDAIKEHSRQDIIIKEIILFFMVSIGQGLLHLASTYSILNLRLKVEKDIREEIFVNLIKKDLTFHNKARTGDIMALATK